MGDWKIRNHTKWIRSKSNVMSKRHRMETAEMKMLRKIRNEILRDKEISDANRTRCEFGKINHRTKKRQIEWNKHMDRNTDDRTMTIAKDRTPNRSRAIGRLRKTWSDNISSGKKKIIKKLKKEHIFIGETLPTKKRSKNQSSVTELNSGY